MVPSAEAPQVGELVRAAHDLRDDVVDVARGPPAGAGVRRPLPLAGGVPEQLLRLTFPPVRSVPRCVVVQPPPATQRPGREVSRRQPEQGWAPVVSLRYRPIATSAFTSSGSSGLNQAPEEMIGAAKELVEATAKSVLLELGETVDDRGVGLPRYTWHDLPVPRNVAEAALQRLQHQMRSPHAQDSGVFPKGIAMPAELVSEKGDVLRLSRADDDALQDAVAAVRQDLRFEYMRDPDKVVERFAVECWAHRDADLVPEFVRVRGRVPRPRRCYMPVQHLSVEAETEVFGIRLLPVAHPDLPVLDRAFGVDGEIGSVASVEVAGTNLGLMATRATLKTEHALRVLRVALRAHPGINDMQLRFTLGTTYVFEDGRGGWRVRADSSAGLGLDAKLMDLASGQAVTAVPSEPTTRVHRSADLALGWIERAQLTGDPLVALLFQFFALEAILGDESESQKAMPLAFRQALLDVDRTGGFSDPDRTWLLYDKVRSAAVHGSTSPTIDRSVLVTFAWSVRQSLNQFLELSHERGFERRSKVLDYLRRHPQRDALLSWLQANGPVEWRQFASE